MGISLAPAPAADATDPLKKKPIAAANAVPSMTPPAGGAAGGGLSLAPSAPMAPAALAPGAIPAPTITAPAAPVDRVKLATDTFNASAASTQGAYDAASRDNIHNSAALGQVASGGLRTREGNLQLARARDLDVLREKLVNSATEGSIADASTAFQQALAGSQQGLAAEIGKGNLAIGQGSLALEKEKAATGANQSQQQIDLAKKAQDIDAAYKAGTMTLAQKEQALRELQNSQSFGLEGQKLDLAKEAQAIDAAYKAGSMTLAQKDQALRELANQQSYGLEGQKLDLAKEGQSASIANQQGQLQLAKDQLAQAGTQFGLSLAQQKELATLADKTQNRQLDISGAQGQQSLLLELARIMGAKDSSLDPNFLASIAKALGIVIPEKGAAGGSALPPPTAPPPQSSTPGNTPNGTEFV